jgi:epoxyqueuosine reductase
MTVLEQILKSAAFDAFSWTELELEPGKDTSIQKYQDWLDQGYQADMDYLKRHLPLKQDPTKLLKDAKSAIVVLKNYLPHPYPLDNPLWPDLPIALYARGKDYHRGLKAELEDLKYKLLLEFPDDSFASFVDSQPVMERALAVKAGLGWIGKNSCLIHPRLGSFVFIGGLLTTMDLKSPTPPTKDHCAACTLCLQSCPSQAIQSKNQIDSRKCLSYLSIENNNPLNSQQLKTISHRFVGCDECQLVCPYNKHLLGKRPQADRQKAQGQAQEILSLSNNQIKKRTAGTSLSRISPQRLKELAQNFLENT